MIIHDLVQYGALPVLEKMAAFTEARHRVLVENIANIDTPGYRAKHLDAKAFQRALREALERRGPDRAGPLRIRGTRQFGVDSHGRLWTRPSQEPLENVLFHDGTAVRVEKQMAQLAENLLMHQAATELLRERFSELLNAIRGRTA